MYLTAFDWVAKIEKQVTLESQQRMLLFYEFQNCLEKTNATFQNAFFGEPMHVFSQNIRKHQGIHTELFINTLSLRLSEYLF